MRLSSSSKRDIAKFLSTLVVFGIIDIGQFVSAMARVEGLEVETDSTSDSFLEILYKSYGHVG